jgi:hypothetical protein
MDIVLDHSAHVAEVETGWILASAPRLALFRSLIHIFPYASIMFLTLSYSDIKFVEYCKLVKRDILSLDSEINIDSWAKSW